jgi:hypothetical protein
MLKASCLPGSEARAADGFWILGPDLALSGQTNWYAYNGVDAPEGAYMGWLFAGTTNLAGTIDLQRSFPPAKYYVMLKVIDYTGGGKISIAAGGGSATTGTTNDDWNKYWTLPVSIQASHAFSGLTVTLLKTMAATNVQKYLLRGLYITTNANENVPLYGEDRIANWAYPVGTNTGSTSPANLIENGSFEVGLGHGWGFMAEGYDRDLPISSLWDTNQAWQGTAAFRFPSHSSKLISRICTVKSNQVYTLSAWVRSAAPSGIGMGIYNVGTPPSGLPAVQNIAQTFYTTTNWTRISVNGFLPAYPNSDYQVVLTGESNVWVDAIQLEEDGLSPFKPHAAIEIGFASDKPGRIFFEDENPSLDLLACNSSTTAFSGTVAYEVFDVFNRKITSGEIPLAVSPNARSVQSFALPVARGIFRVVAWVKGVDGTMEEVVYAVVPRPRTQSADQSSIIGVSPNLLPFELAMHQRLGYKWARAMSPEAIFRWASIEPVEGQITWYDEKVNQATNYGLTIMGTIGSNNYWPPWADTNGLPDLDKWEAFVAQLVTHYRGRVPYWEIWNEPIYTFTPQFYAQMLQRAANAIRQSDPAAKIVGMGGVYSSDWVLQVMGALGTNWSQSLDVISTHLYPPSNEPSIGETADQASAFRQQVVNQYGVEVWNTETGVWDQGFYKTANSGFSPAGEPMRPYLDSERYFQGCYYESENLLINFLHCVGNGLTKYFYYDSRIYVDPSYLRSHPTMLEYDDTIRSKGITYAIAGYLLGNSVGLGSVSPDTNTTYAYLFAGSSNATVALWSKDRLNHSLQLGVSGWKIFDLMGNQILATNSAVVYGRTPVYVQSASLTSDTLGAAFRTGIASNISDTLPPNLSIDQFPTGPVSKPDISLRWLGIDETSIPSPVNPNAVAYSYMLQGRDTNWSAWTPGTHVLLTGLPGGTYTFQVRGRDAAGNVSATESRQVIITPPTAPPTNLRPL